MTGWAWRLAQRWMKKHLPLTYGSWVESVRREARGEAQTGARVHTVPMDDLFEHETDENAGDGCWCGPTAEVFPQEDGPDGWLFVHHSADGREYEERGEPRPLGIDEKEK